MKFPSLKNLAETAADAVKRFPFEIVFALAGTVAGIINIENSKHQVYNDTWCVRVMMIANLGVLLSLAATLYCESKGASKLLFKTVAALIAASFLFIINPAERDSDYIRFFLLSLSFHLLVSFVAFIRPDHIQGFWQFNKTLFLRFLTSVLYSAVLFLGIAAAIGATNFLFNLKWEWDVYSILWVVIVGLFNTIFFLAGVPKIFVELDQDFTYPKGLKVFTQYVLIPLASLYLIILLAYEVKILFQWDLPKGMASNLILSYAVFGIMALLLVFPIRGQAENKWIKTYSKSFYFLMLPLIVLLVLAIYTRISRYGITEYRYFLMLLAFWLLVVTLYFLTSKKQNIKLIPMSLCVLILFSVYGPQSAFTVSMLSQRRILLDIFKRNDAYKGGKLQPVDTTKIKRKDGQRAVETIEYLVDNYDITCLQPYINKDLTFVKDSFSKTKSKWGSNSAYLDKYELKNKKVLWLETLLDLNSFYFSRYGYYLANSLDINNINYEFLSQTQGNRFIKVTTYDLLFTDLYDITDTVKVNGKPITIKLIKKNDNYFIRINGDTVLFETRSLVEGLMKKLPTLKNYCDSIKASALRDYTLPDDMLTINKQTKNFEITIKLNYVRCGASNNNEIRELDYTRGQCLIRIK